MSNTDDSKILQFPQTKKMRDKQKDLETARSRLDKINRLVLELKKLPEAFNMKENDSE